MPTHNASSSTTCTIGDAALQQDEAAADDNKVAAHSDSEWLVSPDPDEEKFPPPNVTLPKGCCTFIMEPLTLLFCMAFQGLSPLISQYVYHRIGSDLGLATNGSSQQPAGGVAWCNGSAAAGAGGDNASAAEYALTQMVQNRTSTWILYRDVAAGAGAALSIPLLSSWSDRAGRRLAIAAPCIGSLAESLVSLCVVAFDLPLVCMLVAAAASGLCGGIGCLFAGALAYLADVTPVGARPMRISVLEALTGVGGAATCILIGWWIRWQSFLIPHAFCTALYAAAAVYCLFFVPEVRAASNSSSSSASADREQPAAAAAGIGTTACRLVRHSASDFCSLLQRPRGLPTVYGLVFASVFVYCAAFYGTIDLTVLYSMNYPFCLDSVLIGYFSAMKQLALQLGMLLVVRLLHPALPTLAIAALGMASTAAGAALLAAAWDPAALWISIAASAAAGCPVPMYRAFVSMVTPADKQGCAFSAFGVLQMTAFIVGNLGFTYGYKATLMWQPGFVFYTVAAALVCGLFLTVAAQLAYRLRAGRRDRPAQVVIVNDD